MFKRFVEDDVFISHNSMIELYGELVCRRVSKIEILNALSEIYGIQGYYYCLGRFDNDGEYAESCKEVNK